MPEIELRPPARGRVIDTTWGEVEVGNVVIDKKDRMHYVQKADSGWVQLKAVLDGATAAVKRPLYTTTVRIYEPSEEEALTILETELGAKFLMRDIEQREHTIARQLLWRMDPMARNAKHLRDHLDLIHAVNVDDVLRKHDGTKVNPKNKSQKQAALDELATVHDLVHDDPHAWPMAFPHHHARIQEDDS